MPMRLWSFIFTDATAPLVSARIAAPDRQTACDLMAAAFGNSLHDRPTWQAGPGVICQFAGEIRVEKAGVVSRVPRAVP